MDMDILKLVKLDFNLNHKIESRKFEIKGAARDFVQRKSKIYPSHIRTRKPSKQ